MASGSEAEDEITLNMLQGHATMISEFLSIDGGGGGGHHSPHPASKASIEAMRKIDTANLEPDQDCPVCLVEIAGDSNQVVREMPCKHRFHEGCIKKWLGMHGSCPVCRFQMPVEPQEEEEEEEEMNELFLSVMIGADML